MMINKFVADTPIIKLKHYKLQDRFGNPYELKFPYSPIVQCLNCYAKKNGLSFDDLKKIIIDKNIVTEFTLNNILSNNELYCIRDLCQLFDMINEPRIAYIRPADPSISIIEKRDA